MDSSGSNTVSEEENSQHVENNTINEFVQIVAENSTTAEVFSASANLRVSKSCSLPAGLTLHDVEIRMMDGKDRADNDENDAENTASANALQQQQQQPQQKQHPSPFKTPAVIATVTAGLGARLPFSTIRETFTEWIAGQVQFITVILPSPFKIHTYYLLVLTIGIFITKNLFTYYIAIESTTVRVNKFLTIKLY